MELCFQLNRWIKYANLSTTKSCAAFGVANRILFRSTTSQKAVHRRPQKHCQPPLNGRISITVRLCCTGLVDSGMMPLMKYWEIVADKLSAAGLTSVLRRKCLLQKHLAIFLQSKGKMSQLKRRFEVKFSSRPLDEYTHTFPRYS